MRTLLFIYLVSTLAHSAEHMMIDTLGASPKGQFVALEEYGLKSESKKYFVQIKIMNVWTKEYVGKEVIVEIPAMQANLVKARQKAKLMAQDQLSKFKISG